MALEIEHFFKLLRQFKFSEHALKIFGPSLKENYFKKSTYSKYCAKSLGFHQEKVLNTASLEIYVKSVGSLNQNPPD